MEVTLDGVVGSIEGIPEEDRSREILHRPLDATEVDRVAVMEPNVPVVDLLVDQQTWRKDPVALRKPLGDVVVHVVFQGVALPRCPLLFLGDAAVQSVIPLSRS